MAEHDSNRAILYRKRMKRGLLNLQNVTLVSINGTTNSDLSLAALEISARSIHFGATKLLAACAPTRPIPPNIEFVVVPKMDWDGYNEFSVKRLVRHVETDFVLSVQPDGFVLNPLNWRSDFLNFDYIGAPWPWSVSGANPSCRVGNSGFCLRSRRFLQQTSSLKRPQGMPDDVFFCSLKRLKLEKAGIRFAPPKIAARFSIENPIPENPRGSILHVFGFHGRTTPRARGLCQWLQDWHQACLPLHRSKTASKRLG